jgi:hypothetical protein
MAPEGLINLDICCAEAGRTLGEALSEEKVLNDALAVLEEHGPYAMFLYVKARRKEAASLFEEPLLKLLKKALGAEGKNALEIATNVANDLDTLLFARDLLRTALVYARFHLKAKGGQ